MAGFTLTNKAKADLLEIVRYPRERWGLEQRDLYLRMLDGCFRQLAANPRQGIDCSEIRRGYRKLTAGSHVIFHRQFAGQSIEIVRVLHGRMDLDVHLSEP
jgi:toxin ParE1/3/4